MKKYFCLCCGFKTLTLHPPGTHEICEICGWEDDVPDGIANTYPLNIAKENFKKFNVSDPNKKDKVRAPTLSDDRIDFWESLTWPGK